MKRRVLITGAAGFLGGHFSRYLREWAGDVYVIATDVAAGDSTAADEFVRTDLAVANAAAELVRTTRPDCIVHLAGVFGAGDALELYRVNVLPLTGLLDAVVRECPGAALITAGSAAEYGRIEASRLPATEDHPCEPVTAYGQSKLCATHLALYYHRVHGLAATVVRPFQLLGKGVTPRLAPGAFYEQLRAATAAVSASSGATAVVRVGNLESQRDFLDVRDACAALWALCTRPAPGAIFNLCSGRPTRIGDLLEAMVAASGARVHVEVDPARVRGTADVPVVYGSFERLRRHCGWRPAISLADSVRAMFAP